MENSLEKLCHTQPNEAVDAKHWHVNVGNEKFTQILQTVGRGRLKGLSRAITLCTNHQNPFPTLGASCVIALEEPPRFGLDRLTTGALLGERIRFRFHFEVD